MKKSLLLIARDITSRSGSINFDAVAFNANVIAYKWPGKQKDINPIAITFFRLLPPRERNMGAKCCNAEAE